MMITSLSLQAITIVNPPSACPAPGLRLNFHVRQAIFLYLVVFLPWIRGIIPNVSCAPPIFLATITLSELLRDCDDIVSVMAALSKAKNYHAIIDRNHLDGIHHARFRSLARDDPRNVSVTSRGYVTLPGLVAEGQC